METMLFLKIISGVIIYMVAGYLIVGLMHKFLFNQASTNGGFLGQIIFWPAWLAFVLIIMLVYNAAKKIIIPSINFIGKVFKRPSISMIMSTIKLVKSEFDRLVKKAWDWGRSGFREHRIPPDDFFR
jgi:hypothetical protein